MPITNSLGFIIKCQKAIELDGGHSVTYCILDAEHDGKCRPAEGIAKAYNKQETRGH